MILVVHLVASPVVNKSNTAEKQQGIYKITKEMVPRRGRRTFYLIIYLQLLIFDLKLKSGPESGPLRSEGRHLYSRINSKLTRATALTEWRQLLSA